MRPSCPTRRKRSGEARAGYDHDPCSSRRLELADLYIDDGARVQVPPSWSLADHDAEQLLHAAADSGLEGIVSKRIDSIYEPGRRSSAWIILCTTQVGTPSSCSVD
ncbi:hypothetical protein ACFVAV_35420 [Nocardia sp. NPDC057663]|uniref:ATP-dependent DNA ligase n=1 Tax=Nocardia sp. NPDC057663 TaxID=3346201 RepID=UPI00366AD98B